MATLSGAEALGWADETGSLEAGKQMDAVLVAGPAIDVIRVGADTVHAVIKKNIFGGEA